MALTRQTESNLIYLQVKHFSLWREIKKQVNGCEAIEVTNPKTGSVITKYGYRFREVSGRVTKLVKYDTERKYPTRYFGFKMHIQDGAEIYVLDMPYTSQVLRRFLRVARNIDWRAPLSITVFKGRNKEKNTEELGVWFQQHGETVKAYYTRENPRGMPAAIQDPHTHEWDFKAQHRWLVDRLKEETIPDIEEAAKCAAPPVDPEVVSDAAEPQYHDEPPPVDWNASNDDVPF